MNPVQLIDGSTVDSSSEAWRLECEARHVLSMPSVHTRREYLANIQKRRGDAAYKVLADKVREVWAHNRGP